MRPKLVVIVPGSKGAMSNLGKWKLQSPVINQIWGLYLRNLDEEEGRGF